MVALGSVTVYLVIKDERDLSLCLERIRPITESVMILEERNHGNDGTTERYGRILNRLFGWEVEEEMVAHFLTCLGQMPPTGGLCCEMGGYFYRKGCWQQAVFWYENALRVEGYQGLLPCMRLGHCYSEMGDWSRAKGYYKLAEVCSKGDKPTVFREGSSLD